MNTISYKMALSLLQEAQTARGKNSVLEKFLKIKIFDFIYLWEKRQKNFLFYLYFDKSTHMREEKKCKQGKTVSFSCVENNKKQK